MPKEGGNRHKSRAFHPYSKGAGTQSSCSKEAEEAASASPKEWEDATCPICMEFPHNAVLLVCASHDNGCRPYVCDTSYRHSNCFDQYRKLSGRSPSSSTHSSRDVVIHEPLSAGGSSARTRERSAVRMRPLRELLDGSTSTDGAPGRAVRELGLDENSGVDSRMEASEQEEQQEQEQREPAESVASLGPGPTDLLCPLCRGKVIGWKVVEQARRHLNGKTRNCAQEACAFIGSYDELRKHARCTHPFARPSDIDPVRQRDWRHLERERDIGDVLSTIQSAMPGARILGDYVIDEDNEEAEEEGEDNDVSGDEGNWWTVFLLFQVFGPVAQGGATGAGSIPASRLRGLSTSSSRAHHHHHHHHQHHRHLSRLPLPSSRQALWGEDIQVNQVEDGQNNQRQYHRSNPELEAGSTEALDGGTAAAAATATTTTTATATATTTSGGSTGGEAGGTSATSAAPPRRRRGGRSRTRN